MIPIFVQTQSPYQLPSKISGNVRVIVRAIDQAGNVRDEQMDIVGFSFIGFLKDKAAILVSILLLLITAWVMISHYLFVRRVSLALDRVVQKPRSAIQTQPYRELPSAPQEKKSTALDVLQTQAASPQGGVYSVINNTPRPFR